MGKDAKNALFIGLAFFATYFGAGNLIFPPMLGLESGSNWLPAIAGLVISGIALPVIGVIVISFAGGTVNHITGPISKNFYSLIVGAIMVFATFVSVPRTAAVAAELGVQGILPQVPYIPIVLIYFALAFYFASNKESVIDKIGKILTPALTIILVLIVIKGFITPVGTPVQTELADPFVNSFLGGYQTGDVLVSFMMANVFIGTIIAKGYKSDKERNGMTIKACLVAFVCLFVIYGGLLFLGACGSGLFAPGIERAELLTNLVRLVGGSVGINGLGIAVVLACLTTAVGQISAIADYFVELSKDRFNYKITAVVVSSIGTLLALLGVDNIVAYSTPLFLLMYPTCIVLVIIGIVRKWMPNAGSYRGAVALTLAFSALEAIQYTGALPAVDIVINWMPLSAQGLGWVLPGIVGFVIGTIIYKIKPGKPAEEVAA